MELFQCDAHYIFVQENHKLWCDKITGEFSVKQDFEWASAKNLQCLGTFYGIIGKIDETSFMHGRILLIKHVTNVGKLCENRKVYKIKSIAVLHLGIDNYDLGLLPCEKHNNKLSNSLTAPSVRSEGRNTLSKRWGTMRGTLRIKVKNENCVNTMIDQTDQVDDANVIATSQVKMPTMKRSKDKNKDKLDKVLFEELDNMFSKANSFFFCNNGDVTCTLDRLHLNQSKLNEYGFDVNDLPIWKLADDRFFWNKHMLKDIIALNDDSANQWIMPIIQGFIQIEKCQIKVGSNGEPQYEMFKMAIISRKSRFMAGTRFQRRGVDDNGNCANYVETEQLLWYIDHQVSFVQIRASVPVYWSQPGYKYKPPPRLDEGGANTQIAFEKHFQQELDHYGSINIVNLMEQSGNEKIIWDAYSNHVAKYKNPLVSYTTFDFYENCQGMHNENVSILINSLERTIGKMRFSWYDSHGSIYSQNGIFRINCIDCLDRTNIVQTALAKVIIEMQLIKLGLLPPEGTLPLNIYLTFQSLWVNNGDELSKQFAGTYAIKGDCTATNVYKSTGLIKDGVNSVNRYYSNRFKDVHKQVVIDLMLGNAISENLLNEKTGEEYNAPTVEQIKLLIENCQKLLILNPENIHSSWGLIDADPITGDPNETEIDTILILTKDSYYVAYYDDQVDKITYYQRVSLSKVTMIEYGQLKVKTKTSKSKQYYCIRINYQIDNEDGYFHMFRRANLQFFNNVATVKKDKLEYVDAISKAFAVAMDLVSLPNIPISLNKHLEKRISNKVKTKYPTGVLDISSFSQLTYVSETQLHPPTFKTCSIQQ